MRQKCLEFLSYRKNEQPDEFRPFIKERNEQGHLLTHIQKREKKLKKIHHHSLNQLHLSNLFPDLQNIIKTQQSESNLPSEHFHVARSGRQINEALEKKQAYKKNNLLLSIDSLQRASIQPSAQSYHPNYDSNRPKVTHNIIIAKPTTKPSTPPRPLPIVKMVTEHKRSPSKIVFANLLSEINKEVALEQKQKYKSSIDNEIADITQFKQRIAQTYRRFNVKQHKAKLEL